MADDKTRYLEAQTLDRVFNNDPPDGARDGVYVALWTVEPSNTPDAANEVSGDQYSPVNVTASEWTLTNAGSPRQYENDVLIDFGKLDSTVDKTVAGFVLYDGPDPSTDNPLFASGLAGGAKTVAAGNKFEFEAGNLTISED
ncbi:hypothetical protein EXE44_04960 [Halorubrum sp. SS7]|uniref:phage tail fiber protein n=1 Tax=unclassified Halorubrum TaxID=2642239 RepID=UPI0010F9942C|nr:MULTISPECIES: hypothetical protein [unclassified Halorubrum]TKX52328.1 hypothetical protein EXE42_16505 [Halorubrum sp. SP3]TKX58897.1 hypothetical protein EXE44_04960 [Halorubrum sp. SS7]TKX62596.1 hypothetical protein EXE45_16945 [Halorubrum sp. SP9]